MKPYFMYFPIMMMFLFGVYFGLSLIPIETPDLLKGVMLYAVSQGVHETWLEWKKSTD